MRFLFGDSTPFEGGFHVLDALRHWVDASVDLLLTCRALEDRERRIGEADRLRQQEIAEADLFFQSVIRLVSDEASASGRRHVLQPHTNRLISEVESGAREFRKRSVELFGEVHASLVAEIRGLSGALGARLGRYLRWGPLPLRDWELELSWEQGIAEGEVTMHYHQNVGVRMAVVLDVDPAWSRAPRVSDLCSGSRLEVGTRRAFLSGAPKPVVAALDDWHIVRLELAGGSFSLHLAERPGAPVVYVVHACFGGEVSGHVVRPGGEVHSSPASDQESLRRLYEALRRQARPLTRHEGVLTALRIDDEDRPVDGAAVRTVLGRIGTRLAPLVTKVFEHSPNRRELSLKREQEDGRREELYVGIDDLRERLEAVPKDDLQVFAQMPFLVPERHGWPEKSPNDAPPSLANESPSTERRASAELDRPEGWRNPSRSPSRPMAGPPSSLGSI